MKAKFPLLFLLIICFYVSEAQNSNFRPISGNEQVAVQKNVMIPAADGVKLATDIYRPAQNGQPIQTQLPLLLQRTPYGKSAERFVPMAIQFAAQGYVVAVQDLRGRYDSEGVFSKYSVLEASDGAATVEYLSTLPYVNGQVGMWGTSYGAHTQADAAKLDPNGLAAMVLNMGGMANAWDHAVRQGGAFELGRELSWAFRQIPAEMKDPVVQAHFELEQLTDWYTAWPFRKGLSPLAIAPPFEAYMLEESTHGDYDDFWKKSGINWVEYYAQTADVPMVHVGGWYDIFLRGTIQNYVELDRIQTSPKWLVIGPWTHGGNHHPYAGEVDFGAAAAIPDFRTDYQLRWFDYLLKDQKSPELPNKSIQLFVMGTGDGRKNAEGRLQHGGYWLETEHWPLAEMAQKPFYLHADGSLSEELPDGAVQTTFTFDPERPVPTLGGNVSARVKDGAFNQRERPDFYGSRAPYLPLGARRDILVFQTEPLQKEMQIIGPIELKLYVASSSVDTDFTVKLLDVYPPSEDFPGGFDLNLTDGIVRMSYRNGRHERELIEPGKVYEVTLELFPTANVFTQAHRIRLDISSRNFPRWDVNPNTGEPLGQHRRMLKADNSVFHSTDRPSQVLLPLVPITPSAGN